MPITFYIDESGHSGDAVKCGNAYDFKDQPFFVLGAIGVEDEITLSGKILELRQKHRPAAGEMKAKSLLNKPEFVCVLLEWVCGCGMPVFVELVDKKYFLCMNIVTTQVIPPSSGLSESVELNMFRNHLADFLYGVVILSVQNLAVASRRVACNKAPRVGDCRANRDCSSH